MKKQPQPKPSDPLDPLRTMVRYGHLFSVQDWINYGHPLLTTGDRLPNVLLMAVDSGFHSMVEVLAGAWPEQAGLDRALSFACSKRRMDMVRTLMGLGADITKVPLWVIAGTLDKDLMSHVFDRWDEFDQVNGLYEIVTSMPRPLTGLIRERRSEFPNSQMQLARAMKHFVKEDHPLWVGLTIWMGGDARLPCPSPDDEEADAEEWTTPLKEAVELLRVDAVRAMKVTPDDNPTALLKNIYIYEPVHFELVRYLLTRGASVNDKASGGSSVLEKLLSPYRVWKYCYIDKVMVEQLVQQGARFCPDDNTNLRDIRRGLGEYSAYSLKGLLQVLLSAITDETLLMLLNTPKLRASLNVKSIVELRQLVVKLRRQQESAPPTPPPKRKRGRPPRSG
jgi:hypothetical protein